MVQNSINVQCREEEVGQRRSFRERRIFKREDVCPGLKLHKCLARERRIVEKNLDVKCKRRRFKERRCLKERRSLKGKGSVNVKEVFVKKSF